MLQCILFKNTKKSTVEAEYNESIMMRGGSIKGKDIENILVHGRVENEKLLQMS